MDPRAPRRRRTGRLLAGGLWTLVAPGVYLSAAHRGTTRARIRAGALWLGDTATLIGVGAAWWWRLWGDPPEVLRFAVPPERRVRSRPGFRAVRRVLEARRTIDGVAVASRAYAVVDAAAELGLPPGRGAHGPRAAVRPRDPRGPAPGAPRAPRTPRLRRRRAPARARRRWRPLGGRTAPAPTAARGGRHGLARRPPGRRTRLRRGSPRPRLPRRPRPRRGRRWAYHRDLPAFRRDQGRQNALVLAGWTVLRVDRHDLEADPDGVLATLRAAGPSVA